MLIEATGAAQGRVVFTPEGDRQSVSVSFNGSKIAMPSLTATSVDGQVQIENAFGIPLVRGNAAAKGLTVGGVRLDTATVTASVVDGATQFEAAARGPELDLSGAGSLADDNGAQVIRLTRSPATPSVSRSNIASPATVRIEGGTTTISGVNLSVGGGSRHGQRHDRDGDRPQGRSHQRRRRLHRPLLAGPWCRRHDLRQRHGDRDAGRAAGRMADQLDRLQRRGDAERRRAPASR